MSFIIFFHNTISITRVLPITIFLKALFVADKHLLSLTLEALKILTINAWISASLKLPNIAKTFILEVLYCVLHDRSLASSKEGIIAVLSQHPSAPLANPPPPSCHSPSDHNFNNLLGKFGLTSVMSSENPLQVFQYHIMNYNYVTSRNFGGLLYILIRLGYSSIMVNNEKKTSKDQRESKGNSWTL